MYGSAVSADDSRRLGGTQEVLVHMRTLSMVVVLGLLLCLAASMASADHWSAYFWVIQGHDVAGTGVKQAGVTPYLSAEDWVVGTPAYSGTGGPDAVRKLPGGKRAPIGTTPTERMGKVRVALGGLEAIGATASFSPTSRLATVDLGGKVMVMLPGARTAVVDGQMVSLSDTPTVRDGTLYVPVRDVAEKLMGVDTDSAIKRICRAVPE
jgi:hypothetical protein